MALGTILAGVGAASGVVSTIDQLTSDDGGGGGGGRNRGSELRKLFRRRLEEAENKSPTETTTFRAGTSAIREALGRQRERDESAAAARGLSGSQFEVAQDANRARTLGRETRNLLATSANQLRQDEQSALEGILQSSRLEEQIRSRRARRKSRRNSSLAQIAGAGLQAGATIFSSMGGAGGGGGGGGGG